MASFRVLDEEMCNLVDDITSTVISCGTRELCQNLETTTQGTDASVDVKYDIFDDKSNGSSERRQNVNLFIKFATRIAILARLKKPRILVYCKNGRSRSPSVIATFFVLFRGFAVEEVKSWFNIAFPKQRPVTNKASRCGFPNFDKFTDVLEAIFNLKQVLEGTETTKARVTVEVESYCRNTLKLEETDTSKIVHELLQMITLRSKSPIEVEARDQGNEFVASLNTTSCFYHYKTIFEPDKSQSGDVATRTRSKRSALALLGAGSISDLYSPLICPPVKLEEGDSRKYPPDNSNSDSSQPISSLVQSSDVPVVLGTLTPEPSRSTASAVVAIHHIDDEEEERGKFISGGLPNNGSKKRKGAQLANQTSQPIAQPVITSVLNTKRKLQSSSDNPPALHVPSKHMKALNDDKITDLTIPLKVGDKFRFCKPSIYAEIIWDDSDLDELKITQIILKTSPYTEHIVHFGQDRWESSLHCRLLFQKVGTNTIQTLRDYDIHSA